MTLRSLSRREHWMHAPEWAYALRLRRAVLAPFREAELPLTTALILLVHDYLISVTLARRAERVLVEEPDPNGLPLPAPPPAQLDGLAKQRERARKLLLEINDFLPKPAAESTKPMGLADRIKPLMKKFKHLESVHFPEDHAFRIATPDTPGAPFRYPRDPATLPKAPEDYVVEESPSQEVAENGDDTSTAPSAPRKVGPPEGFKHYIPSYLRDAPQEEAAVEEETAPPTTDTPPEAPAPSPANRPKPPPSAGREERKRYVAIVT